MDYYYSGDEDSDEFDNDKNIRVITPNRTRRQKTSLESVDPKSLPAGVNNDHIYPGDAATDTVQDKKLSLSQLSAPTERGGRNKVSLRALHRYKNTCI